MKRGLSVVALVLLIAAGCASSLGNRDPIRRSSLAWRVQPGTTAEQAGDFVKQGAYTFALIAAAQDSAGLDLYLETMRGIIDRQTSALGDIAGSEDDARTLDAYNAMSYNLAADLADCWPGDAVPPTEAE